jgi:hypothetical protein
MDLVPLKHKSGRSFSKVYNILFIKKKCFVRIMFTINIYQASCMSSSN